MNKLLKSLNSSQVKAILWGTLSATFLATSLIAIAKPLPSKYGLGLPPNTGSAGAVRSGANLPPVVLLAPEDGGRTVSQNPTFYWYFSSNLPYRTTFQIVDVETGENILKTNGISSQVGLYKFALPETVSLKLSKMYKWQLVFTPVGGGSGFNEIGYVLLAKEEPEFRKALNKASNDLAKAKVYSNYGYWYDALASYNQLIQSNPKDNVALQSQNSMISEVFTAMESTNKSTVEENVSNFIKQLNTGATIQFVGLKPRN